MKKYFWLLILIIAVGFSVRLYHLDYQSIWFDESVSINAAKYNLNSLFVFEDPTPPLYYILLHFWTELTGDSVFAVRFLPVIFGVLSIYMIYLVGKNIHNAKTGLIASLLLALSPIHIYYSQEARCYSLFFFLALCSMYFYLKFIKEKSGISVIGCILVNILLVYTHIFGFLIILAQLIHFIIINFKKIYEWIAMQAIVLICFAPWAFILYNAISKESVGWMHKPGLIDLLYFMFEVSFGKIMPAWGLLILILFSFLILKYIIGIKSKIVVFWALIPVFVPFILSQFLTPLFSSRYVLPASLALTIMIAYMISRFRKNTRSIVIIALITLLSLTIYVQQNTVLKEPWKDVSAYVSNQPIAIMTFYEAFPFAYYHDKECLDAPNHTLVYGCLREKNVFSLKNMDDLKFIEGKERLWLIISKARSPEEAKMLDDIHAKYDIVSEKEFLIQQNIVFSEGTKDFFNKISSDSSLDKIVVQSLARK